jgi:hypothetical protein
MEWRNGQTLYLKLKDQINVNDLAQVKDFTFVRNYRKGSEIMEDRIECSIQGIRWKKTKW